MTCARKIEDAVRDLVADWRRQQEVRTLCAISGQAVAASPSPSLTDIIRRIDNPWGQSVVPHHFECCEFAVDVLRRTLPAKAQSALMIGGMEVRIDKSLPLGRIRVMNADGLTIEEFELSPDAMAAALTP